MSLEAMKIALIVLESFEPWGEGIWRSTENIDLDEAIKALRKGIAETQKQEADRIRPKGKSWLTVNPDGNIEMREIK